MANKYTTLTDLFTGIADAIRVKKNSTGVIVADTFPTEIDNLKTGFDYNNQNVTVIPDYAFYGCEDLKSVDCCSVTSVGASAFEGCSNLETVVLHDGVENVGENAFKGCGEDLTIYCYFDSIPETWHENWNSDEHIVLFGELIKTWDISSTGNDNVVAQLYGINNKHQLLIYGQGKMKNSWIDGVLPWDYCGNNIYQVIIKNGVTNITSRVFNTLSNLNSIMIPDSVTEIGSSFSPFCPWLIQKQQENPLVIINNNLIDATKCSGDIIIPDNISNISTKAFYNNTKVTSVVIPNGITILRTDLFTNCKSLVSITIPYSVTNIGSQIIAGCEQLASIVYTGTVSQWNAITFDKYWSSATSDFTIYCTDGTIAKDGTITYHTTT